MYFLLIFKIINKIISALFNSQEICFNFHEDAVLHFHKILINFRKISKIIVLISLLHSFTTK